METWTDESMERPSTVPVNLIGGTLIYCDPESFPTSVPIDDKWKVLVCPGLHGEGQVPQESFTGSIQVKVGIKGAVHLPHGTIVLWLRGLL
jgi:hypothetical protein